jgi:hypothetical protein
MLSYSYYPFKNVLENIDGSDLLLLRDVAEGWYIDYKRENIKQDDYAKQLCAFANQYGGWLIIGVEESQEKENQRMASDFIGIDTNEIGNVTLRIREAASSGVNPEVLYEEKVINGPIHDIGLKEGKSIIILGIPASNVTPHIHKSGRVYRRIADQSKPKEETDRFILDELWKKGEKHKQRLHKLLTDLPPMNDGQADVPFLHVFFYPSSTQLVPAKKLTIKEFRNISINLDDQVKGLTVELDSSYRAVNGYVGRQVHNNNPLDNGLTLRWWDDGRARMDIPLNTYNNAGLLEATKYSHNAIEFEKLLSDGTRVVNYSNLVLVLMAACNMYTHMLKCTGDKRHIYSCFTLRNVFHTVPFIDSSDYVTQCYEYSVPYVLESDIVYPELPDEDNMMLHKTHNADFSLKLILEICKGIGVVGDEKEFFANLPKWATKNTN